MGRKEIARNVPPPTPLLISHVCDRSTNRYAIGSGKYVLWRRMVREVPELMERTPQEARQRWLSLTGRLGGGVNGEGGREEEGGHRVPGSPALDTFYVQVRGWAGHETLIGTAVLFGGFWVFGQVGHAGTDDTTKVPTSATSRCLPPIWRFLYRTTTVKTQPRIRICGPRNGRRCVMFTGRDENSFHLNELKNHVFFAPSVGQNARTTRSFT